MNNAPTFAVRTPVRTVVSTVRSKVASMWGPIRNSPVKPVRAGVSSVTTIDRSIVIRNIVRSHGCSVHKGAIGDGDPVLSSLEGD